MPGWPVIDDKRIRQLLEQGVAHKFIAQRLGISKTAVHRAVIRIRKEANK